MTKKNIPQHLRINTPINNVRRLIPKRDIEKVTDTDRVGIESHGQRIHNNIFSEKDSWPDHIFKFPLPKPLYTKKV